MFHHRLPPHGIKADDSINGDWIVQDFAEKWHQLNDDRRWGRLHQFTVDTSTLATSGSYSVRVRDHNLRIIALNTLYCARLNFWNVLQPIDLAGQLDFLVSQLSDAETLGETVHIVGHIAPSERECIEIWYLNYVRVLRRFKSIVKASFFGHSHNDEFMLYPGDSAVAILSGSITTWGNVNPCYKVFSVQVSSTLLLSLSSTSSCGNLITSNLLSLPLPLPSTGKEWHVARSSDSFHEHHRSK